MFTGNKSQKNQRFLMHTRIFCDKKLIKENFNMNFEFCVEKNYVHISVITDIVVLISNFSIYISCAYSFVDDTMYRNIM